MSDQYIRVIKEVDVDEDGNPKPEAFETTYRKNSNEMNAPSFTLLKPLPKNATPAEEEANQDEGLLHLAHGRLIINTNTSKHSIRIDQWILDQTTLRIHQGRTGIKVLPQDFRMMLTQIGEDIRHYELLDQRKQIIKPALSQELSIEVVKTINWARIKCRPFPDHVVQAMDQMRERAKERRKAMILQAKLAAQEQQKSKTSQNDPSGIE